MTSEERKAARERLEKWRRRQSFREMRDVYPNAYAADYDEGVSRAIDDDMWEIGCECLEKHSPLRFSTTLPTVNGWYWQRPHANAPRPYDIYDVRICDGVAEIYIDDNWYTIEKATAGRPGEWAGPIPEPE